MNTLGLLLLLGLATAFFACCWYFRDKSGHIWTSLPGLKRECGGCGRVEVLRCRDFSRACPEWWEVIEEGSGDTCDRRAYGDDR